MKTFRLHTAGLALGVAVTAAAISPVLAMPDQAFLKQAIEGDNSEIALGKLAQSQGASASTKTFGQTLATDHAKALADADALAKQVGVTTSTSMSSEASEEMTKLKGLSGAAFDKEFADYMVKDHQKDISDFREQADSGETPVANFARMSVPTLQKHLDMARDLKKSGA